MHEPFDELSSKAGSPSDTVPDTSTSTHEESDVSPAANEVAQDVEAQVDIGQDGLKPKRTAIDLYLLPAILMTIAIILCLVITLGLNGTSGTVGSSGRPTGWQWRGESTRDKVIRALKHKWDAGLEVIQTSGDGNCLLYSLCEYIKEHSQDPIEEGFLKKCAKEERDAIVWHTIDNRNVRQPDEWISKPENPNDYWGIQYAYDGELYDYFVDQTWMTKDHARAWHHVRNKNVILFSIDSNAKQYSPNTGIGVKVFPYVFDETADTNLDVIPCGILHVNGNHYEFVKFTKTMRQLRTAELFEDLEVFDKYAVEFDALGARLVTPHPPIKDAVDALKQIDTKYKGGVYIQVQEQWLDVEGNETDDEAQKVSKILKKLTVYGATQNGVAYARIPENYDAFDQALHDNEDENMDVIKEVIFQGKDSKQHNKPYLVLDKMNDEVNLEARSNYYAAADDSTEKVYYQEVTEKRQRGRGEGQQEDLE